MVAKVVLNRKGVRELLRGNEVRTDLERRAKAIASRAGDGFEADSDVGPARARASVRTADRDAMIAESHGRALTRALDAGRG